MPAKSMKPRTYKGAQDSQSDAPAPDSVPETPSDVPGSEPAPAAEAVECRNCGHVGEPVGRGQCSACRCWLPGNAANLRHGLRRYQDTGLLPPDMADYRTTRTGELVEALGGAGDLSPQREMLCNHVANLEVTALLQLDFALRTGAETKRGRQSLADYRASVLALRLVLRDLGLERQPGKLETLQQYIQRKEAEAEAGTEATP